MTTVNLHTIAHLIKSEGIPAEVEMTGGNIGTIYVGENNQPLIGGEPGDIGFEAVVGPGTYSSGDAESEGLCVGPHDANGESEVTYFSATSTNESIARFVSNYVRGGRVSA